MTCLRCHTPITGRGSTGMCQKCAARPAGATFFRLLRKLALRRRDVGIRKLKTILKGLP
jgi:hypothetical protein